MNDKPEPGYWQASDGNWYPPEGSSTEPPRPTPANSTSTQSTNSGVSSPGGFLAFLGWTIAGLGVLACFFTLDRLADASQFADLEFADYILSLQGPLVTTGIGLIAAATGHLLSRQSRP